MERTAINIKLTEIFRKVFNNNSLDLRDELTANHVDNWDSLTHMLLIAEIEASFQIKFKLRELNRMRNVGDMVDLLTEKLSNQ